MFSWTNYTRYNGKESTFTVSIESGKASKERVKELAREKFGKRLLRVRSVGTRDGFDVHLVDVKNTVQTNWTNPDVKKRRGK